MGRKKINKIKKKNRGARSSGSNNTAAAAATAASKAAFKPMDEILPSFHRKSRDDEIGIADGGGGYYDIYKRSTTKFWNWMKERLPSRKMSAVNDLIQGVDEIHEEMMAILLHPEDKVLMVVPNDILLELSKSIRYRQLVTDNRFDSTSGSDDGHNYMLEALKYCKNVLKWGRRVAKVAAIESQKENEGNIDRASNAFSALIVDDQEEDEEEEDDTVSTPFIDIEKIREGTLDPAPFESPEDPKGEEINIEMLINGDDRFQCLALLNTMDDYMGTVHQHYGLLKNHLRGQDVLAQHPSLSNKKKNEKDDESSDDGILKLLMECTVVVNMATDSINEAENSLKIDHPHILSFYHVLAIVHLPNYIVDIEKMLTPNATTNSYGKFGSEIKRRHAVLDLVATIVETAFHSNPNYGSIKSGGMPYLPRINEVVKAFTRKFGLKSKTEHLDKEVAQPLFFYVMMQTYLTIDQGFGSVSSGSAHVESHSWLKCSAFIGGDNSILNTHNIIQKVLDFASTKTKLIAKAGFWGKKFDEKTNPAKHIRGDLDEIFAGCILPEIIVLCMQAPLKYIPECSHLLTLLDVFQHHIKKDQKGPLPIAVSFSFHALLTSIFVLQGSGDLGRIASLSKASYNKLFAQLDVLSEPKNDPQNAPNFYRNVGIYKQLVNIAKPKPNPVDYIQQHRGIEIIDPHTVERFAYWNPLIGGEYMLFCTYLSSIGLGSATIDTLGQLRLTLHLYNALKEQEPSLGERIPLLDKIDKMFSKCKAIWVGGRPDKGSYAKHFFMSWGHSISSAKVLAASQHDIAGVNVFQTSLDNDSMARDLDEILPENYNESYQSVVQHIFPDDASVREYTVLNPTKESLEKHGGFYDFLTRVNMARDSMDEDEDYLSLNLSAVGCILLKFSNELSKEMGWDDIISQILLNNPEVRMGKTVGGRKMKAGGFLASDLNMIRQGVSYFWGMMLSQLDNCDDESAVRIKHLDFMENFFSNINREDYIFFVKENELSRKPDRRNPLEGPYPYGRTGLTIGDPLQGFLCLKYNKAGMPDTRIIFPGKLTHFIPDQGGCAESIMSMDKDGSKVEQLPNGKYRHIASYTLNELIDLGWDGAWYVSTRVKHGATGMYVPFINGYDSDEEDEYEPFDVEAGKRAGTIGRPPELKGRYMIMRDHTGEAKMSRLN